jgi:hypothetical protein
MRYVVIGAIGGVMLVLTACSSDRLNVPNYQSPTVDVITRDPGAAIPLLATGVLRDDRGNHTTYILGVGILGREAYNYTPTEGRNTSGYLIDPMNSTSFGGVSNWSGPFFTLRDAFNTLQVAEAAPASVFNDAQKNAVRGFVHTMEALALLYLINTRHDLGIPVELTADPTQMAPFVSRDSAFNRIVGLLNQAQTELTAAGTTAFPFTFHAGYAGFTTPATYIQFNRALAARVNAYRASLGVSGCGAARSAACYNTVLTNLSGSHLNAAATTTAQLAAGPFNVYSAAANDVANGLSNQASTNIVAHFRADSGIQLRADGVTLDARYTSKVITLAAPKAPPSSVIAAPSSFDYSIYAVRTDPVRIIKNEELILLRAEARFYTGDPLGALADINTIRQVSGSLAARGPFVDENDFLNELLYNRRLSLLFEGHRWVDMRRFGRLGQLTIDRATHVVVPQLPVPQAECLQRANAAPALAGPGC